MDELIIADNFEPSIDAEDSNLRKLARRKRLKDRQDHATKITSLDERDDSATKGKMYLEKTIDSSNETLFKIFVGGKELVTNVSVSADTKEIQRRKDEVSARDLRIQKLEDEAALASDKFMKISEKWEEISRINGPLDLGQEVKDQKSRCADLTAQKDALICDLKNELKLADKMYMKDRTEMWEDLCVLAQRINEQVLVMKNSYMSELSHIEEAIGKTRDDNNERQSTDWKHLYDIREQEEVDHLGKYLVTIERDEEDIQRLYVMHDEQYRKVKIQLDTEIQILQQELERIKAICLVTSEKLDYNYQVLKKREDENVIVKNNQKRMLNKLQDEVTKLRKQKDEKDSGLNAKLSKVNKEICRMHRNIIDIEKKADHFSNVNNKKFMDVWRMKTNDADILIKKIEDTDKIIHEKLLGLEWEPHKNMPLKLDDLSSYKSALAMIAEVFLPGSQAMSKAALRNQVIPLEQTSAQLRSVLSLIADNSEFLIEERLDQLLRPYTRDEQTLVRLDNVFNAIGVQKKYEVDLLYKFFLPHATCNICFTDVEREINATNDSEDSQDLESDARSVCSQNHPLHIQRQDVLKVLKDFVLKLYNTKMQEGGDGSLHVAKDRCTISRLISNDDIMKYWTSYQEYFPKERLSVWEELYGGLTKYYKILQDRATYAKKVRRLRAENAELLELVDKYVQHSQ